MNYLIKQATLNKIASLRLAINYILRNRMVKFATGSQTPTPPQTNPQTTVAPYPTNLRNNNTFTNPYTNFSLQQRRIPINKPSGIWNAYTTNVYALANDIDPYNIYKEKPYSTFDYRLPSNIPLPGHRSIPTSTALSTLYTVTPSILKPIVGTASLFAGNNENRNKPVRNNRRVIPSVNKPTETPPTQSRSVLPDPTELYEDEENTNTTLDDNWNNTPQQTNALQDANFGDIPDESWFTSPIDIPVDNYNYEFMEEPQ